MQKINLKKIVSGTGTLLNLIALVKDGGEGTWTKLLRGMPWERRNQNGDRRDMNGERRDMNGDRRDMNGNRPENSLRQAAECIQISVVPPPSEEENISGSKLDLYYKVSVNYCCCCLPCTNNCIIVYLRDLMCISV